MKRARVFLTLLSAAMPRRSRAYRLVYSRLFPASASHDVAPAGRGRASCLANHIAAMPWQRARVHCRYKKARC